jgi:hypothetical protein
MDACSSNMRRSCHNKNLITIKHHYYNDKFTVIIDQQLQELNNISSEQTTELFMWSATLDSKNTYKLFSVEDICRFVDKFYLENFSDQKKIHSRFQLQHYDIPNLLELKNLSLIVDLRHRLVETRKSIIYPLIDRLIRLILTLFIFLFQQ